MPITNDGTHYRIGPGGAWIRNSPRVFRRGRKWTANGKPVRVKIWEARYGRKSR